MSRPDLAGRPTSKNTPVTFIIEDADSPAGRDSRELTVPAVMGECLLDLAMSNGIDIEHACGGVCACSTCHVYIEKGMNLLSAPVEAEEDRVEEAPGLQRNSRLSCQCVVQREGPIIVRVPAWNRNAVKEVPHH
ncbi:MAG: 2Fe-2S iron-sulfur cluster binding domain-containing protein [Phycisphaerae bacterium]|nr:2Fe-2S iron-sulfur cluster binding domain-containing protein [Phycisphaerae bacterium]